MQAKANLEKTKAHLEEENKDLGNDLKSVQMAKQESERKKKQAESQVSELTAKLVEQERQAGDAGEKSKKLQVWLSALFFHQRNMLEENKHLFLTEFTLVLYSNSSFMSSYCKP